MVSSWQGPRLVAKGHGAMHRAILRLVSWLSPFLRALRRLVCAARRSWFAVLGEGIDQTGKRSLTAGV
jgi:hypothetical protein